MGQDDKVLHRSGIKMDRYSGDIGVFTAFMQVLFHSRTGLYNSFYSHDKYCFSYSIIARQRFSFCNVFKKVKY